MNNAEMKNGPHFEMWVIGIAAGLVAGAVMYVVGQYGLMASAFVGALVVLVVSMVFGMPKARVGPLAVDDAAEDVGTHASPVAGVVAADAAPMMAMAAPAAFVAMPAEPAAAKPAKAAVAEMAVAEMAVVETAAAAKPVAAPKAKKAAGPARLTAPRKGKADDLKDIEGIGPAIEKLLSGMGFYHFDQIAGWSDADVALVDSEMKTFKGRIVRDKWVAQAKIIVAEGLDAFRERAKTNNY